jgi:Arc/MetJ-type ribon-helix-helix transcriptional regulator
VPKKTVFQEESKIVNIRMPPALVSEIDTLVTKKGYMSRSEFILSSVRYYLEHVVYRDEYLNRMAERGMMREAPRKPKKQERDVEESNH